MGFSPDEASVDDFSSVETFDLFEEEREQVFAISFTEDPGRTHVPMTESAEVDHGFLGDADSDICFRDSAGFTDVADGGQELYAAHGTEDGDFTFSFDLHC